VPEFLGNSLRKKENNNPFSSEGGRAEYPAGAGFGTA